MADTKISQDYSVNPFTWDGTEVLPGIKAGANGAGLVSALRALFATLNQAQNEAPPLTIASSGSVAIGAAAANTITISGTNTITSFDTIAAGAWRRLVFSGILTLTHNGTSLILPSGANITTGAGDSGEFLSLGSGNWRCVSYTRASGSALTGSAFTGGTLTAALNEAPQVTIASAATTDIGAATANSISVTGTATITALGTIPSGALRRVVFTGSLTLTHSGTALILPGAASITTAAGDVAWFESLGSGNWRCVGYHKASGAPVAGASGLTHFTESVNSSAPNGTVPVVRLLATNAASNVDAAFSPKGNGGIAAHVADSTVTGGNKRGANAVDWQTVRASAAQAATGAQAVIAGGQNNIASGAASVVVGGGTNTASGNNSTVGGGSSNTASNSNSTIAGGSTNTSTGQGSFVGGGVGNNATGSNYPAIGGGSANTASGSYAYIGGGLTNTASGDYSTIPGGREATTRGLNGAYAWSSGGLFGTVGANQFGRYLYKVRTTDATVTTLAFDGGSPSSTTVIVLPNESVYSFHVLASATQQSNTVGAGWTVTGTIRRDANAGSTTLVGTPVVTTTGADAGAATWTIAAVANTTRGSLEFTVTGEAAKTIRWTLVVDTCETTE